MGGDVKYPAQVAGALAARIVVHLGKYCERIAVAGSLRREHAQVGDVEIVYIPRIEEEHNGWDLFAPLVPVNRLDEELERLQAQRIIRRRRNRAGHEMYGPKNKLVVHLRTGIPIDFFATDELNWFNYLVCRTGGARNNIEIATAAQRKGWTWNPYGSGFSRQGEQVHVNSESEVYEFVGLPWKEPRERA